MYKIFLIYLYTGIIYLSYHQNYLLRLTIRLFHIREGIKYINK